METRVDRGRIDRGGDIGTRLAEAGNRHDHRRFRKNRLDFHDARRGLKAPAAEMQPLVISGALVDFPVERHDGFGAEFSARDS